MKWKFKHFALLTVLLVLACAKDSPDPLAPSDASQHDQTDLSNFETTHKRGAVVQHAQLGPFMPAGPFGGPTNLLVPGTFFAPTKGSNVHLLRGKNFIQFQMHTTGLPAGAYTVWYIIFNNTDICTTPNPAGGFCGEPDLFGDETAVVWATGGIVQSNGVGNFGDRIRVGEERSETIILGSDIDFPLTNPAGAEVHLIVKYHGAASSDPDVLYGQTHTLLGNCGENDGANSFDGGPGFGIQCFDPQLAVFPPPN
ncbi:MAG: hypothetical protein HKN76_07510 [Saprospiraceae bacterium]|nr:hypothetical protein [Saprospiraceae bacterium]